MQPADNELSFEPSLAYSDNRTGIALGSTVGSSLLHCVASRVGSSTTVPIVSWVKDGNVVSNETGFSSSLEIANFSTSDAGTYQCIDISSLILMSLLRSLLQFHLDSIQV